tara:strand:- start:283 stop:1293 length:1011 start_codon:yes stop_codon:yes gene_type:complete
MQHEIDTNTSDEKIEEEITSTGIVEKILKVGDLPVEALIKINSKYTANCYLNKEPNEIVEQLSEGMQVDVKTKRNSKGEIIASINDAITEVKISEILEAIGDRNTAFKCKVEELIHGGYWVNISGVRCFMPGSLAGLNKLYDFEIILGKELIVMPILYSRQKDSIVVSHREYLNTLVNDTIEETKETIKEKRKGFVTGATRFGVFVEFEKCLTGLIPLNELDEGTLDDFNNRSIKPGYAIDFWVKDIMSKRKIILTQKGPKVDLWDNANLRYIPMQIVEGKVRKVTRYGAFIELEKGISGLIHKSTYNKELSRGDRVMVKIKHVNIKDRKISLSLI